VTDILAVVIALALAVAAGPAWVELLTKTPRDW